MCKTKEAQSFLKQLKKLDCMIRNKLIEKEQWKEIATGTTAHSDGDRVQSSGSQQKMADAINKYIDIEREIDTCIDELIDSKKKVIAIIQQLNTVEYDVLHKIYVQYLTFEDVANEYGRSYSWVTTVNGRGLVSVQRLLDEQKKR